jgi:hypothetical protein
MFDQEGPISADDEDLVLSTSEDVHDGLRYLQATVNALIEISKASYKVTSDSEEFDTDSEDSEVKNWPSILDILWSLRHIFWDPDMLLCQVLPSLMEIQTRPHT